jgi:4-hydroxy-4-methyl-2-oxoglutarate aldolase
MLTESARSHLLGLYEGLRVADVRDGMDWMMHHGIGSVDPAIRPVFRTRICGLARTIRYLPTNKKIPDMSPDEYTKYAYDYWYGTVTNDDLHEEIVPGDIVMIDASGTNVGIMGSNVVLAYLKAGARGVVTNGGCRDTDEVIHEKFPMWSRYCAQAMNQGRIQWDASNIPIAIGGQLVRPEDVVVADGDGVIIVPLEIAEDVARYARQELENDKAGRRRLYDALGWEPDDTVR